MTAERWLPLLTILKGQIKRFLSSWYSTLLPACLSSALYLLVFGGLMGDAIGDIGGQSYQAFIIPGIILMAVIVGAYQNAAFSLYMAKFENFIEEMLVSPISNATLLGGFVLGAVCRALIIALTVTLIARFFGAIAITHLGLLVVIVLLTASLFSLGGFINGLYANSWDDTFIVPIFVLTPLAYLGGVFYSIDMLPTWGQYLSQVNPVFYMINGFRFGLIGVSDIAPATSVLMLLLFNAALWVYAMRLLNRGVGLRS